MGVDRGGIAHSSRLMRVFSVSCVSCVSCVLFLILQIYLIGVFTEHTLNTECGVCSRADIAKRTDSSVCLA